MKKSITHTVATVIATLAATAATTAFAHPGHEVASGAMAGFMHPLTGFDHLIALLSLGALLARPLADARTRWVAPAAFGALAAALTVGAGLGLAGYPLPFAEWAIALSVLVAGLMLLRSNGTGGTRPAWLVGGAALFALFHGYAHGTESSGDAVAFVAGFLASSLVLVAGSAAVSRAYAQRTRLRLALGAGASIAGVVLLSLLAI